MDPNDCGESMSGTDGDVLRVARGDPEAFGALFERHARAIHAFLVRRAGRQVGDDLLGEVFVTAFDARLRYDLEVPDARPWLYGIARNVLRSHARGGRRRAGLLARVPVDTLEVTGEAWSDVDARLDAAGPGAAARAALRTLPDGDREVVELLAWESLSLTEVAAVLGIPTGTARSRLHRARAALRVALDTPANSDDGTGPSRSITTEV